MANSHFTQPPTGVWSVMAPVKGRIAVAIALSALSSCSSLASLLTIPFITAELLSVAPVPEVIWRWVAVAVVLVLIAFTSRSFAFRVSHIGAFNLEVILRTALAEHLAKVPLGYVIATGSGAIKKLVQDDVKSLHAFVADSTPLIGQAYTIPIISLIAMLIADWRLGLTTLMVLPVGLIFMQLALRDYKDQRDAYDQANESINSVIIEFVQGMQVVRTFDDGSSSFARFQTALDAFTQSLRDWNNKTQFSARLGSLLFEPLPTLVLVSTVGTWLVSHGSLTIPRFLVFLLLAPRLCGAFKPIFTLSYLINQANAGALRISAVLAEPTLPQPMQPQQPADSSISFRNVTFAYGDGAPALQNISLQLPAGSVTALVGPSGAGKTTLARLLPRFWDVDEGAIEIGGVDIRQMTSETLMSWVSFVFQDTFLFQDTVFNNIKLGRPDATQKEVEAAAQAAQAHGFILDLPQGYGTLVGERGGQLSGGQRQRITIARAILQDNPIVVLDEATAFADPENEALIQAAIAALTRDKTLIVIAHRLATIVQVDQIAVLDRGRLIELGKHNQLIAAKGLYNQLWSRHQAAQNWGLNRQNDQSALAL
ncbi:ABC transporter ATP-binding protein [Leptolyngbyaceae cyanobacterium CCMR0082]|uniref:ABC transporter ATP-binding protein n=1 Tax=Adonisia turfae CCMR0082 TaxID=2304604 RepID=A0A6M0S0T4_9CYAN|nr:ABC transporter ATP-binding protein [Adonisia turfae]NEZ61552.1 ABC transporter ATP-binding protein [Adonisia turfae CCMR0082]